MELCLLPNSRQCRAKSCFSQHSSESLTRICIPCKSFSHLLTAPLSSSCDGQYIQLVQSLVAFGRGFWQCCPSIDWDREYSQWKGQREGHVRPTFINLSKQSKDPSCTHPLWHSILAPHTYVHANKTCYARAWGKASLPDAPTVPGPCSPHPQVFLKFNH